MKRTYTIPFIIPTSPNMPGLKLSYEVEATDLLEALNSADVALFVRKGPLVKFDYKEIQNQYPDEFNENKINKYETARASTKRLNEMLFDLIYKEGAFSESNHKGSDAACQSHS